MKNNHLDQRALKILKKLIERYIRDGQPVGSKTLAEDSTLMLSSASIRNIMAELEEAGYLRSPHTSAGRIPTTQGYRLFVDHFITIQPLANQEIEGLRHQLIGDNDAVAMTARASSLLSNITNLVGVVMLPKRDQLLLKLVEFVPLSERSVLVILVFNDQEVQNRVIVTERKYSASELEKAGNYLTQYFSGKDIISIRQLLLDMLRQDRNDLEQMIKAVMEIAEKTIDQANDNNLVLAGETNLFQAVDQTNYHQLKIMFETFSQKRDVLHLFDQVLHAQGMQIYIGEESGHQVFDDFSVVATPYRLEGKVVGVLGVIGPTRMSYPRVITAVDITAKLLSQALE